MTMMKSDKITKVISINGDKEYDIIHHVCSICECVYSEDEGGLHRGYIGMLPVSFCPTCLNGVTDMVIQMVGFNDIDILEERIQDLKGDYDAT